MCVSFLCIYKYIAGMQCPRHPEEGARFLGSGVTDGWNVPRGFWESNLGSLQEHYVVLTVEPSLHPLGGILIPLQDVVLWDLSECLALTVPWRVSQLHLLNNLFTFCLLLLEYQRHKNRNFSRLRLCEWDAVSICMYVRPSFFLLLSFCEVLQGLS